MADLRRLALERKFAAAEAAGDKERAKRLRARLGEAYAAPQPAGNGDDEDVGLDAVTFASPAARAAAEEAGMNAESFKRRRKSSEAGFTKADVERIAGTDEEED